MIGFVMGAGARGGFTDAAVRVGCTHPACAATCLITCSNASTGCAPETR